MNATSDSRSLHFPLSLLLAPQLTPLTPLQLAPLTPQLSRVTLLAVPKAWLSFFMSSFITHSCCHMIFPLPSSVGSGTRILLFASSRPKNRTGPFLWTSPHANAFCNSSQVSLECAPPS